MLAPVRTAAPAAQPVTLAAVKAHLRIDFSDHDDLLDTLIEAATDRLDGYRGLLGRAIVTQTWRQDFASFQPKLRLALAPVASIEAVTYYDGAGGLQTLAADAYVLLTDAAGSYVAPAPGATLPGVYQRPDAVRVTYVAGVAPEDVPRGLQVAIMLMVGDQYAPPGSNAEDIDRLIGPHCRKTV